MNRKHQMGVNLWDLDPYCRTNELQQQTIPDISATATPQQQQTFDQMVDQMTATQTVKIEEETLE